MRVSILAFAALLLGSVHSQAAVITGKVVPRDPTKPIGVIDGFRVEVTRGFQPGGVSLGTFPSLTGITLTPASATANSVDFSIDLGDLGLGSEVDVTLTFRATGRTPAVLQVAGNQNQVVAIVLPIEPTVDTYPCPPPIVYPQQHYYPCCYVPCSCYCVSPGRRCFFFRR